MAVAVFPFIIELVTSKIQYNLYNKLYDLKAALMNCIAIRHFNSFTVLYVYE